MTRWWFGGEITGPQMELQLSIFDQPSFANAGGDVLRSENLLSVPSLETALPTESVEPQIG